MVTVRTAKNKASSFEYSCSESIQQKSSEAYLTKQGKETIFSMNSFRGIPIEDEMIYFIQGNKCGFITQEMWDKITTFTDLVIKGEI
jgi:hypothetical protein